MVHDDRFGRGQLAVLQRGHALINRAIVNNKEKETGISIHYVNEHYDEGAIIFQANVALTDTDTPETVAEKIHELEQKHFPEIIHRLLEQ